MEFQIEAPAPPAAQASQAALEALDDFGGDAGAVAPSAADERVSVLLSEFNAAEIDWGRDECLATLDHMERDWGVESGSEGPVDDYALCTRVLGIAGGVDGVLTFQRVHEAMSRRVVAVERLALRMTLLNILNEEPDDVGGMSPAQRVHSLLVRIKAAREFLDASVAFRRSVQPNSHTQASEPEMQALIASVAPPDPESKGETFPGARLALFILRKFQQWGLARYGHGKAVMPFQQVYTTVDEHQRESHATHYWEPLRDPGTGEPFSSMDAVINYFIPRVTENDMWRVAIHNGGARENMIKWLQTCQDPGFPQLRPNRYWFAFRNGLFHTETCMFYRYGDASIPPGVTACQFFDQYFGSRPGLPPSPDSVLGVADFLDVPTEATDQILRYQLELQVKPLPQPAGRPPMTQEQLLEASMRYTLRWTYALLGRLLFPVGRFDNWQVLPVIIGLADTGKSTWLDIIEKIFPTEEVRTLSGENGDKYTLASIYGGMIWTCPEIGVGAMPIPQMQLQSIVSGESVSIREMHQVGKTVKWTIPGIMSGNQLPAVIDNSGSMSRRFVMFHFKRKVLRGDPALKTAAMQNYDKLLYKMSMAYMWAVSSYGKRRIWETVADDSPDLILPQVFHDARRQVKIATHPLAQFLDNSGYSFDPQRYQYTGRLESGRTYSFAQLPPGCFLMPWQAFQEQANEFIGKNCTDRDKKEFSWARKEKYMPVLDDLGLFRVTVSDPVTYGLSTVRGEWLIGAREMDSEPLSEGQADYLAQTSRERRQRDDESASLSSAVLRARPNPAPGDFGDDDDFEDNF
jgi:hypothetical protein